MSRELLDRIDDFRFQNRLQSRAEAIRALITDALARFERTKPKT